jgi:hypothetical protein
MLARATLEAARAVASAVTGAERAARAATLAFAGGNPCAASVADAAREATRDALVAADEADRAALAAEGIAPSAAGLARSEAARCRRACEALGRLLDGLALRAR